MEVLLCRHGNTFKKGHPSIWIGQKIDLPLTEEGREQANKLAAYLINNHWLPTSIFTAPLKRTTEFASILAEKIGITQKNILQDERLSEIKYGSWEGKTTEELTKLLGADLIRRWELGEILEDFHWDETKDEIFNRIRSFLNDLTPFAHKKKGTPLLVTSNGVLKVIYQLVSQKQAPLKGRISVGTGALCKVTLEEEREGKIIFWNKRPS